MKTQSRMTKSHPATSSPQIRTKQPCPCLSNYYQTTPQRTSPTTCAISNPFQSTPKLTYLPTPPLSTSSIPRVSSAANALSECRLASTRNFRASRSQGKHVSFHPRCRQHVEMGPNAWRLCGSIVYAVMERSVNEVPALGVLEMYFLALATYLPEYS
jgi:hypothetical protein